MKNIFTQKFFERVAWVLAGIGVSITIYFVAATFFNRYWIWGDGIDFSTTGEFGDFMGGVVGTIISGASFIFLYFTLTEQRKSLGAQLEALIGQQEALDDQKKAFSKERFESKFFELIKLYRENVAELKYTKYEINGVQTYENRQVFRIIFSEFIECLKEVKKFSNSKDIDYYLHPKYKKELEKIRDQFIKKPSLYEMLTVDLAYCILFYGLDYEGANILRERFSDKYQDTYFPQLIRYMQLKPAEKNTIEFNNWVELQKLPIYDLRKIVDEIYINRRKIKKITLSQEAKALIYNLQKEKYYSGHQFRLGHYYRHLFQSYLYLDQQDMKDDEKYYFGKTFRAQFSTYEQGLLFVNSISSLGMKWELKRDTDKHKLITKYQLVKNLPNTHIFGIYYKVFYPEIQYETDGY